MREIIFYTTQHCSLCDAALDLLLSLPEARGFGLTTLDIAADQNLLNEFGERIPVIAIGDVQLDAPFDALTLQRWLKEKTSC
tara:strand:+ start:96 stop:341 length:246 start_codon:yes stop_codon:yes gene_type:complete